MKFTSKLVVALFVITIVFATFPANVGANMGIAVTIDGDPVIFPDGQGPVIVGDRTLVPIRGVFETLGFNVGWNPQMLRVTLTRAETVVEVTLGSSVFESNGQMFDLEVPARLIEGRTMIPLRAVLEVIGYDLGWNQATRTVLITPPVVTVEEQEPVANFPFAFAAEDLFGNMVTHEDLGNKELFVVHLWATWCGPCVAGLPAMGSLYEEFGDRVGIIGLLIDYDTARERALDITNNAGVR